MNNVNLIGNVCKDIVIEHVGAQNTPKVRVTLGVTREDNRSVSDFITCTFWGAQAELVSKYAHKGSKLAVSGSWRTGSYTNKNGITVYTNELNVRSVDLLDKKEASTAGETPVEEASEEIVLEGSNQLPF